MLVRGLAVLAPAPFHVGVVASVNEGFYCESQAMGIRGLLMLPYKLGVRRGGGCTGANRIHLLG